MIISKQVDSAEAKPSLDGTRSLNLLYLVHRLPYPPDKGDRIRAFHIIRHLSQFANIDLACLSDEPISEENQKALERYCRRVAIVKQTSLRKWSQVCAFLGRGRTATEGAFHSSRLHSLVSHWVAEKRYDACLASSSAMAPYLQTQELQAVPAIVDLVDVDSQKWLDYARVASAPRKWLYQLEGNRLRRLEQELPTWTRAVTLISEPEADLYRSFAMPGEIHVISNGVDQVYFKPREIEQEEGCVFVGALDYLPNIDAASWYCHEVWPEIHRRHPQATMRIVGRQPVSDVCKLSEIPGVEVVGTVADVRPYLAHAAVVVAPLRIARGLQNKVLEALAMGKATLASPQALEGLRDPHDLPAIKASSAREWISLTDDLIGNSKHRRELGIKGRQYVERRYSWENSLGQFESLLGIKSIRNGRPKEIQVNGGIKHNPLALAGGAHP
ncbi:MAG TPA: TIGR03087 family PEP-CTERM/XrtA system glycosyltransferase [Gemmataceae bacterium]|jgi:sugar transferase (PEP-CTERM/EpsH1 system associated)|nr:TIGR03087 family PEP-CTERM/XrtA system glycosyltransferase [Gemmataceae bacterium]